MSPTMKRYLVTGGAGFIGSHLVQHLLAQGHRVRVLDDLSTGRADNLPHDADLVAGNACDPAAVIGAVRNCEGIFHLAAIASVARSVEDWIGTHRANQTATIAVLEAARCYGNLPVVFASSAAIYGDQCPAAEHLKPEPRSAYGADKAGSELHLQAGWWSFALPSAALRFFNVFGPRQDPASPYSGVISAFLARAIADLPLTIHGDGLQSRDFIFVGDVVRFLHAAMERLQDKAAHFACNVCTGEATTIRRLAEMAAKVAGVRPAIDHAAARTGDVRHSRGEPHAATALLGVRAETSLEDGLAATARWMKAHTLRAAS
ncbi:MAG TPA: NAD-dependent epimerase/dehydratase family protein [Dongiaceae bacterium]